MFQLPIIDNKYVIIGSYALGTRPAKDIDIICWRKDAPADCIVKDKYIGHFEFEGRKVECLFCDELESFQYVLENNSYGGPVRKSHLYAIKAGHIHRPNPQWEKHIADYHSLQNMVTETIEERLFAKHSDTKHLIKECLKDTAKRLGDQRLPKLKGVTKDEFFDDAVIKFFEHDDIHQWFAHKERPMYTYTQPNPGEVYCDKDLWNKFTLTEKLQCVMEECYVIASERHLIPFRMGVIKRKPLTNHEAFKWALMRVCTTLCSGWFRDFSVENYFNILNNYNLKYYEILNKHI